MVTLVKESLEKRVFVDKAETLLLVDNSTLEVTAKEYRKLLSAVKSGRINGNEEGIVIRARNGGGFVMQSGSGGKIVLGVSGAEDENKGNTIILSASWNPQTWFSGQNVVPGVCSSSGNMLMGLADIVEYPFRKLMELCGGRTSLVHNKVNYGRLDFTSYTSRLEDGKAEEVLKFFTSICAKQEFSRKDNAMVGVAHMLGFGFDAYTAGELAAKKGLKDAEGNRICGIVFKKYVGADKNRAFTLSIYDKSIEVEDKVDALRDKNKKPRVLEQNQAMIRELGTEISARLRIEGQIYPDTFLRGLASRFRAIMVKNAEKPEWMDDSGWEKTRAGNKMKGKNGKIVPDSYYRRSGFLRDSQATEDTLRLVLQEMTRQLGLPVIFEAPSQKAFLARIEEEVAKLVLESGKEVEVRALIGEWKSGVDLRERSVNTISLPYKVRCWFLDNMGVDLFSCTGELPRMIRGALMTSTLSAKEQQDYLHGSLETREAIRSSMISNAKELRSKLKSVPVSPAIAQVDWS
jgi:hypothetical protein